MFEDIVIFIKELYGNKDFIALHEPRFVGNERKYVLDAIDSTFVSSVGAYVNEFEKQFAHYVGAKCAIVTGSGTSALHAALHLLGVCENDEVLTQALTFVATANAISYCKAHPIFIDSDPKTLGLCPTSLEDFLSRNAQVRDNVCYNRVTGRKIKVCVPMHVFGHPVQIEEIIRICNSYRIDVLEDAAESLGSLWHGQHTGLFGKLGVSSFNGNKVITSGGGGMIMTQDEALGKKAKHLTTTAKIQHAWEIAHDELGFNYRMPNLNAALVLGQLEQVESFVADKRATAQIYQTYFGSKGIESFIEPKGARSNYWLNCIFLKNRNERDQFLEVTNKNGVMTRPIWTLMPDLMMYKDCQRTELAVARDLSDRIVNLPSSVRFP